MIQQIASRSQASVAIVEDTQYDFNEVSSKFQFQGLGITAEEVRLLNLLQVILDNGWVIDQANYTESLALAGIKEAQLKVSQKGKDSGKHRGEWKPLLASIQTAKGLAEKLNLKYE
ncbi:hypothetical protein FGO68_gene9802 [Halteria grandinella]|uniref:Uncharacterized protein n=1 Tax=Halteria grandinella TaxID=5974 RepID=A0A8J8SV53_HALGN|nr:hypothetical protein FGO68_gene9802 [Halteria grandinella]